MNFVPNFGLYSFRRAEEADVALRDDIRQRQAEPGILMRDPHHEPEVRLDELSLRGGVSRAGAGADRHGFLVGELRHGGHFAEVGVEGLPITVTVNRDAFHRLSARILATRRHFGDYFFWIESFAFY